MIGGNDPRLTPSAADVGPVEHGVMPLVERPRSGLSGPAIALGAAAAAVLLFVTLDSRRRSLSAPVASAPRADLATSTAPLPLYIPPAVPEPTIYQPVIMPPPREAIRTGAVPATPRAVRVTPIAPPPPVYPPPPYPTQQLPLEPPRNSGETSIVFDNSRGTAAPDGQANAGDGTQGLSSAATARARAGMFPNRATTVPQGTLIPAVLETGFDSTRPGFARALVQRDIRGFDGTRVLIPRGSRLFGDYQAEVVTGQNRALITWSRLIRPDGATIALASPATDTVGRGGVQAHVNTHFIQRFSGALLRSILDVGAGLASRAATNSVVVTLPGSFQGATSAVIATDQVKPTLTVERGKSVSVLVARDLDFTEVETTK